MMKLIQRYISNINLMQQQFDPAPPPKIPDIKLKIVLLGDKECGKTSLLHALITNTFQQQLDSFICPDFRFLYRQYRHKQVRLNFWDIQSTPSTIPTTATSYRNSVDVILLCLDLTKSLQSLPPILEQILKWTTPESFPKIHLIGCKGDLKQQIQQQQIDQWVKDKKIISYVKTSSKFNGGIEEVIELILRRCDEMINPESDGRLPGEDVILPILKQSVEKSWCPLW